MRGVRRWNEGGEVGWNRIGEEVGKLKKIGEGGGGVDDYLVLENKQKNLLVLVTEHSNTLKRLL